MVDTPLTMGAEEEFFIAEQDTLKAVPRSEDLASEITALSSRVAPNVMDQLRLESRATQIELVTPVCTSLQELNAELEQNRLVASQAASNLDLRLIATGTFPGPAEHGFTNTTHYRHIAERFGDIAPPIAGTHIHVGVPSKTLAVRICTYLRPWLPVLQALMSNSPFHGGLDTGYSSWRCVISQVFPGWRPPPPLETLAEYDDTIESLISSELFFTEHSNYWYARPSAVYPTVEIRVGDIGLTSQETVLAASLSRALVATTLQEIENNRPPKEVSELMLENAHWRAAKEGLEGRSVNTETATLELAKSSVSDMLVYCEEQLDRHGDLDRTADLLNHVYVVGSGAYRQRIAHQLGGLPAVYRLAEL